MMLKDWEQLPPCMQNDEVRYYYNRLKQQKSSIVFKRLFDIIVSSLSLVLLFPLFLILAVVIKLDSRGPVFYRQTRVTRYGKHFRIHKFRTMYLKSDVKGSLVTVSGDRRITKVGGFLRKYKLDETAQFIDVLMGNMTFVGTRPEVPKYVKAYTPAMMATLLMPAGITSEASILYKDEAKLLKAVDDVDRVYVNDILPQKMEYNLKDIEHFSFIHDLKIIFRTLTSVCH